MRPIDADAFKDYFWDAYEQVKHTYPDGGEWAKGITEDLCKDIDKQPTITLLENEDNPDWLPFEEYDSISTSDERAEILNTITEAIENKKFWVAGYDDTDGVFLKVLLMKGDKE